MFKNLFHFLKWIKIVTPFSITLSILGNFMLANENPIIVDRNARFTIVCPECIRLEYSENGKFIDNKSLFAVNRDVSFSNFTIRKEQGKTIIETKRFTLIYQPDGKPFHSKNLQVLIKKGNKDIVWVPGMKNMENLEGTIQTLDQIRGKIPLDDGILSRDGWYLYDDSRRPLLTEDWVIQRPKDSGIDWYLFAYGYDFKSALKALTTIGGEIPLPRKYVLGSWYSRYWPYSSDDYKQIVQEYKDNDFPLDIIVLDMDWHKDGWTGWSWNRKLLPDAEKLLDWFHEQGLKITLNVHPAQGIQPHEDMYKEFMKDMGVDLKGIPDTALPTIPYDPSNKKYLDNLFKHTHTPLEKVGVDFWWLDWQQFPYTLGNPELKNLEWLNHYYYNHTSQENKRGISFSRWGGWGDHKYPIHFSGDAVSIWPMLEFEVPFTATAGNVGCFFWSHDIGGHFGGINQETNARWVQFGSMTAALRLHSTRDKNMDKRPWLSSDIYQRSMQLAFHFRSQIFPYIYSSAWQSCKESVPLTRPMYIEYPEIEAAYHSSQQYFFGDALLVAPITSPGIGPTKMASQKVWFPPGFWYNWFTGEKYYLDNKFMNVWSEIFEFPLFVKGGIPIPIQPYTQRMTSEPLKHLIVRVYPGEDGKTGEFTLYEDDGVSQDYKNDKFAMTKMSYTRNGYEHSIKIEPAKGEYKGQVKERSYTIEMPSTRKADSAILNGKKVKIDYDDINQICRINVPVQSIYKPIEVKLTAAEMYYFGLQMQIENRRLPILTGSMVPGKKPDELIYDYYKQNHEPFEIDNFISYISGVSVYKEDINKLFIIKNPNSPAGNDFIVTIIDSIGQEGMISLEEKINLKNGESRLLLIKDPLKEHFGLTSSRVLTLNFKINDKNFSLAKLIEQKDSYICKWNILGPFNYDRTKNITDFKYKPETEKRINLKTSYTGKDNKKIKWQEAKCTIDRHVDLEKYISSNDCIVYAVSFIKSTGEQEVHLDVNSDDGVEVFLNNKKIHSNNVFRSIIHDPDKVTAKLKKGENQLLLKISQGEGGMGFKVGIKSQYPITN